MIGDEIHIRGLIAGSGRSAESQMPFLVKQSKNLGLSEKHLKFLGDVENIEHLYREVDILLLTSEYEGSPNCTIESMASGVPVLATNVGNVSEIISNNINGYIIDPYSESEFVKIIISLAQNKKLLKDMSKSAAKSFGNDFALKNHKKLISIFRELVY